MESITCDNLNLMTKEERKIENLEEKIKVLQRKLDQVSAEKFRLSEKIMKVREYGHANFIYVELDERAKQAEYYQHLCFLLFEEINRYRKLVGDPVYPELEPLEHVL